MPVWIIITFVSAFLQNMRSGLQKHLKGRMGTFGATFVRFGFGVPFALLYLAILAGPLGHPLPSLVPGFWLWAVIGGFSQIAATFLLVHLFSYRNFAVGTAYSRTEPAQAALFGLIFLGETVSVPVIVAIAVSVIGVMAISVARTEFTLANVGRSVLTRTAGIGLFSGTLFGLSAVAYRSASLALAPSLPAPDFLIQASVTLVIVILMQAGSMFLWLVIANRAELARIIDAWKPAALTGFVGATASFGWFAAMTLQQAAIVKAVAQIEMLFTFATTVLFFKEKMNRMEVFGCLLVVSGVLILLMRG